MDDIYNDSFLEEPVRSLYVSTKVFSFHRTTTITDGNENVVYTAKTKAWTMHDRTSIYDANNGFVCEITKKMFSFHERHFVRMADGFCFELSNELWHFIKDITNINGLGWVLKGNLWNINFTLFDKDGSPIAKIHQKVFSIHDKYSIDIYKTEFEKYVIAILITLQHMIRDRENASSNSNS